MNCPKCGKDAGESKFCPECGASITGDVTPDTQNEKSKPKKKKTGLIVVLVLALIVVGIIAVPKLLNSGNSSKQEPAQDISFSALHSDLKTNSVAAAEKYKAQRFTLYFQVKTIEGSSNEAECLGNLWDSSYEKFPWEKFLMDGGLKKIYSAVDVYFSKDVAAQLEKEGYYKIEGTFDYSSYDDVRDQFVFAKIKNATIVEKMNDADISNLKK
ncbi:MAG: zinc ribbon domain-containing protein [Clostridia bacterium]|nr:zinc ribbon domain-containing protein [Clostridia bacterium]